MNAQTKKIVTLVVLFGILIAVGLWQWMKSTPAPTPPPPAAGQTAAPPKPGTALPSASTPGTPVQSQFKEANIDLDALIQDIKEVSFKYVPEGRNPMTPLVGRTFFSQQAGENGESGKMDNFALLAMAQRMKVTGIIWDPKEPVAVVDNTVVEPGYTFPGLDIRVKEISPDHVTLQVEDSLVELKLEEQ